MLLTRIFESVCYAAVCLAAFGVFDFSVRIIATSAIADLGIRAIGISLELSVRAGVNLGLGAIAVKCFGRSIRGFLNAGCRSIGRYFAIVGAGHIVARAAAQIFDNRISVIVNRCAWRITFLIIVTRGDMSCGAFVFGRF